VHGLLLEAVECRRQDVPLLTLVADLALCPTGSKEKDDDIEA
jgi:hypothetical protein